MLTFILPLNMWNYQFDSFAPPQNPQAHNCVLTPGLLSITFDFMTHVKDIDSCPLSSTSS